MLVDIIIIFFFRVMAKIYEKPIHSTIVYEEMTEEELQTLKDNLVLIEDYFVEQGIEFSRKRFRTIG